MTDIIDIPPNKRPPLRLEKLPEVRLGERSAAVLKIDAHLVDLNAQMERLRLRKITATEIKYQLVRGALTPQAALDSLK